MKALANESEKPSVQKWLLSDVKTSEDELTATIAAFQKANTVALIAIDKSNRENLFNSEESYVTHR